MEQLRPLPESKALPESTAVPVETGAVTGGLPEALIDGTLGDVADEYGAAAGWCRDRLARTGRRSACWSCCTGCG